MHLLKSKKFKTITALVALVALLVLPPVIIKYGTTKQSNPKPRIRSTEHRRHAKARRHAKLKKKAPSENKIPSGDAIPILVYHDVAESSTRYSNKWLCLAPALFAQQLDWLKTNGYHTVRLQDVYNYWYYGSPLPSKPIVLTFDDGSLSNFTTVLPMLQSREMTGTLFLCPKFFDNSDNVTSDMVGKLSAAGMEIGCHSYSHPDLTRLTDDDLKHETYDAKVMLEHITKRPVDFFCYPCGKYDDRVIAAIQKYGYKAGLSSIHGMATPADNKYLWKRMPVGSGTDALGLSRLLKYSIWHRPRR